MSIAAPTRWHEVVDALVTQARALPGSRAAGDDLDPDGLLVLDGPEVWLTGDTATRILVVGWTLDDDRDNGEASQVVATLGRAKRDETGFVICQAIAQTGSLELPDASYTEPRMTAKALRDLAFGVFATVADLLRADPSLGLATARMFADIGERLTPRQYLTDTGAVCSVEFQVRYDTRI